MTLNETIEYFRDLAFGDNTISPEHKRWLEDITEWLGELKIQQSYKPVDKEFYRAGYRKAVDDFAEALKKRYPIMENDLFTVNDVLQKEIDRIAEQIKKGETDGIY